MLRYVPVPCLWGKRRKQSGLTGPQEGVRKTRARDWGWGQTGQEERVGYTAAQVLNQQQALVPPGACPGPGTRSRMLAPSLTPPQLALQPRRVTSLSWNLGLSLENGGRSPQPQESGGKGLLRSSYRPHLSQPVSPR